ncbi:Lrp/AsnC family transcriptional regulator [Streptomyces genisteinicus]|uniref:Lrp/AsnC family transcriptional regulator n=1 Tax=Streptomyces genisteinicus TaxID=2768068 RepID=A0A7H0HZH4_9ACTN|nr:Lrp/AsnC family transcriptional regulator [Streptomyces genisteinicus]QNP65940.1 Lrp/AsnC family transcriptional regulator [Streptomyces genisteinicus]
MSSNDIADETDRRIASALQLHGRAPWEQIAKPLGLSERTVARRGQRLLEEGLIRVVGLLDTQLVGRPAPVLLRLRVETGHAREVADRFSKLYETRTVMALLGSSDHFVEVIPESHESLRTLLFDGMPHQVRSSSSHPVLRFYTGSHEWNGGALTPEEEAVLRQPSRAPFGSRRGEADLHPDEQRMACLLAQDGRMPTTRLAAELGVSQATASRRLASLLEQDVIRIRADAAPALFGYTTEALLWLKVCYDRLDAVGRALSRRPEVLTLVSIAGDYQVCAHVAVHDAYQLQEFLTGVVGPLDGVGEIDVTVLLEVFKRGGLTATL